MCWILTTTKIFQSFLNWKTVIYVLVSQNMQGKMYFLILERIISEIQKRFHRNYCHSTWHSVWKVYFFYYDGLEHIGKIFDCYLNYFKRESTHLKNIKLKLSSVYRKIQFSFNHTAILFQRSIKASSSRCLSFN